jgi:Domain of unknown function (DUF4340)
MKSTFVKTYVAVALVAGLGAYIYFVESRQPTSSEAEKKKEKLFTFDKTKVKEVSLAPKQGEAVTVIKDGEAWKLTAPLAAPADSSAVDGLVSGFDSLEIDEVVSESPPSLADFGLDAPEKTVGVLLQGATEPLKLLVGNKTPDGASVYAKTPSKPRVFILASYLVTPFDKKPFDLRDRDILHAKRDAIRSLEITGPDGGYALARGDKESWAFTQPLVTKAGRWSVDSLLGLVEGLRMESVAAEAAKDLKPFGLLSPARTLTVGFADGTKRTLEIGSTTSDKKYYARDASKALVAVIPPAIVDDLAKGMKELREKRVLDVPAYEVGAFDVEAAGQAKRLYVRSTEKDKDGIEAQKWKRTVPEPKDLDTNKVQDALFKVGSVEAQDFIDQPKGIDAYGLDSPALKVSIRYAGDKPPTSFEIGKKDGAAYARRPDDTTILKLDPAKADELIKVFTEL